jgi:FkbM family methyltransferase
MKRVAKKVFDLGPRVPGLYRLIRPASLAGRVPKEVWGRLPSPDRFDVPLPSGASYTYVPAAGDSNRRKLYWRGATACEPGAMTFFLRCASQIEQLVDVGANAGRYTLAALASNPALRVVAFEALPRIAERLAHNIAVNHWTERVTLIGKAASDQPGRATFIDPGEDHPTTGRLSTAVYVPKKAENERRVEVEMVRVDDVVPRLRPTFLKVDVEGAEHLVFSGASDFVRDLRPLVVFEMHADGPVEALRAFFDAQGYRLARIRADGTLEAMDGFFADPSRKNRDYLAIPRGEHPLAGVVTAATR